VQFSQNYARWNRAVTNKVVRIWAGWVPAMGLLTHTGRRSGRQYRTPLNVFPTNDGYAILLPYGLGKTEWLKNLQTAGNAELKHYGKSYRITNPRVTTKQEAAASVRAPWRFVCAKAPFADALLLAAQADSGAPPPT
jgi:deazaflavin-dependent oxidoreductase (nitroreductase family)